METRQIVLSSFCLICLQCFDAVQPVGWAAGSTLACKKTEWWDVGMVICLGRGADLPMAQLMPLPFTVLAPGNPDWFYLSGTGSSGSPRQNPESRKMVVVVVAVVV